MSRIHGEFKLELSGRVILTKARGPWNDECVKAFGHAYSRLLQKEKLTGWGDLVVLQGESLLVPDAEHHLRELVRRATTLGLESVALVTEYSTVQSSAIAQMDRMYRGLKTQYAFFDHFQDGANWLADQGFSSVDTQLERLFA